MRYCVAYQDRRDEDKSIYDTVEEILISYNREDTTLPAFIEKHSHQTIRILFNGLMNKEDCARIADFNNLYHNIKVAIHNIYYEDLKDHFEKNNIPFYFFDAYAASWDGLNELLNLPVCDIFVNCELGFHMPQVANRIHEYGKSVCIIPNVASCNSIVSKSRSMNSFFVRPEDTYLYDNLVDTFVFMDSDPYISYKIYKSQKWFGKLNEIIPNLESNVDNRGIPSLFGATRIRCQKRCGAKGTCRVCHLVEQLSNNMMANNMIFRKEN